MLLPDLTPWASQAQGFIYDWTVQGEQLRLTSAVANIGQGRLELRGGPVHGDKQDVFQRIYQDDGTFNDVLAGSFVYHAEHGHIHFENFAAYRLRQVTPDGGVGDIVASGEKISFCLLDVERYASTGPSQPFFLTCGQNQGISVGWADVYDRGLPGQSIDITGLADGQYWLEVVVDPSNQIQESDETNNTTRIQINLQRPAGGSGPIAADAFEANNTFETASILAPPEDHTYAGLSIHQAGDDDYFRITASSTGELAFTLQFLNSGGDIDLEIYNSARTLVGRSDSVSNMERVAVNAAAGEYYYVHAYGYNGAVNSNYTLLVDQPEHHDDDGDHDPVSHVPSAGDDDVVGTSRADTVSLLAGNDRYQGLGGNDTIFGNAGNDWLDGGTGADRMTGGTGDDTYIVDNIGDRVTELSNQGLDKVLSSINYTLGTNVENLELTGTAAIKGTGNTAANVIIGNSGANTLNGMTGRDTMTGGGGADRFIFNTALGTANIDTITDFQLGLDKIVLENAIFRNVGLAGTLKDAAFYMGTAAHDANDRIIYDDLSGKLYYDSNGTAAGGMTQFALLNTGLALKATDFLII